MPEIPPTPTELPKPDPPPKLPDPPPDRAALVAAYPVQAPGTADKKTGGQDPATGKGDAAKADAAKGDLPHSLSDAWNRASAALADTAKDVANTAKDLEKEVVTVVGKEVEKVEENATHFVHPDANEHPAQAAVMNNLAKRVEGVVEGVKGELKAEVNHLGNLAHYATHLTEAGAPGKLLAEVDYQRPEQRIEREVEGMVKGTVQLAENVGAAGYNAVYYGIMHRDEPGAPAKTANAVVDFELDGAQLVLAVDGAIGLGKGVAAGGLSEAKTAAAVDRAYNIEPAKIEPAKVEPAKVELPETGALTPANDNAVPHQQGNEQVLARTGTDGAVAGDQPKLNVIEGGKVNPDAPRAMAGDPPGPRAPGDGPRSATAGTDPVISTEKAGPGGARETGAGGDKPGTTTKAGTDVKPANDNAVAPGQAGSAEGKLTITKPEHGELRFDNGKGDPVTLMNRVYPLQGTEDSIKFQVRATGQKYETELYFEKDRKIHVVDGFYDQLGDKSRVIVEAKMNARPDFLNTGSERSGYNQAITHVRAAEAMDGNVLYRIGGTQSDIDAVKNLFAQDPVLNAAMQNGRLSVELFNL